jgi:hypothetical protein
MSVFSCSSGVAGNWALVVYRSLSVSIAQFGRVGKDQSFRAMVVSFRPSSSNRYSSDVPLVTKSQVLQRFKFKDLEAATGGFDKENLIGRANHGQIYRGVLKDGRSGREAPDNGSSVERRRRIRERDTDSH